jgi:FkbM family methyltransferase
MTSPAKVLAKLIRAGLDRLGYVLWKREFLQYGISPFLDISRLSRAFDCPVGTFFDVGANIGQTAREALDTFPDTNVFSFEPHPDTFKRLTEAVADPRLSAYQIAFNEQDGDVTLYEYASSGDGTQINSLVPDARFPIQFGYQAKERVAHCATIDGFCESQGIERIDVLKIDTEGSELFVMKGAARMLRERRIIFILTEYNDLLPKPGATGGSLLPIAEYLSSFGYMYVASYTDRVFHQDKIFVSANALFAGKEVPGHGLPLVPITRTQSAGNDRLARHPRENLTSILDSP